MEQNKIELMNEGYVTAYTLSGNEKKPAVIVCPGGGYEYVSEREGEPVALQFAAKGYHSYVLNYSVAPNRYPKQILQLAETVKLLRDNANEWHIDKERIYVIGFSAGGHLAGTLAVHWNKKFLRDALQVENEYIKPNGAILCYPVIASDDNRHVGSFHNLTGEDKDLMEWLSLEKHVGSHVCPVFLWHTVDDGAVKMENSMMMAMSLRKHDIPLELHMYDKGVHGLSLCNELTASDGEKHIDTHIESWLKLALEWLERLE